MEPLWVIAVSLSCCVSTLTVLGFVLQSRAVRDPDQRARYPRFGEVVVSPSWILGVLLQAIPNFVGDLIAYTIAPLSLIAPLGGLTVLLNISLAPKLLGERLHYWPDLPATAFILIGLGFTTSFGPHRDQIAVPGLAELEVLTLRPVMIGLLGMLAATLALCLAWQLVRRAHIEKEAETSFDTPNVRHLLLPAWSAAAVGCITNIGMKVLGEFLSSNAPIAEALSALFLGVAPSAILQQQCVNRGLRLYPQTVFYPIYSSLLMLTNTILGAIFFEEYLVLVREPFALGGFCLGLLVVVAGIVLFSLRRARLPALSQPFAQERLL